MPHYYDTENKKYSHSNKSINPKFIKMKKEVISQKDIQHKQHILNNARHILKEEFIGIDTVIDRVIGSISTWFIFPHLQEKPVIINLWGMTGVGKTALIIRLSNLLDFDNKFFRYDMGNNSKEYLSLKEALKKVFKNSNGMPCILMMDEFQYAKTKNENNEEVNNSFSRIIWDLLDSGKFQSYQTNEDSIDYITNVKEISQHALQSGVVVKNGVVVENSEVFENIYDSYGSSEFEYPTGDWERYIIENNVKLLPFLPTRVIRKMYYYLKDSGVSIVEFNNKLGTLNGEQTLNLLKQVIEISKSNKWIDCTKSLIFLIGNLDEAYTMSSSFNPDISANDFYESSLKININIIKKALKRRFRNEQISRLGNNHIIYPAFNEETFKNLINLQLEKVVLKTVGEFGLSLSFSNAFKALIYTEGVYPTQGTRPLFSTIYLFVNEKIPRLLSEISLNQLEVDNILFDNKENIVQYKFQKEFKTIYSLDDTLELNLEKLRKPTRDDAQAITAVHEAGHAVVSIVALNLLPEYICSTTSDTESAGFMILNNKRKYLPKQEALNNIAVCMGGLVAEKIIFGADNITSGAESDLRSASTLASYAIKDYGMGKTAARIDVPSSDTRCSLHDKTGEYNEEVKEWLAEGVLLAEAILNAEKNLLLIVADYLSDERIIKKDKIQELVRGYGSHKINALQFTEDNADLHYRNALKSQVQKIGQSVMEPKAIKEMMITYNKQLKTN